MRTILILAALAATASAGDPSVRNIPVDSGPMLFFMDRHANLSPAEPQRSQDLKMMGIWYRYFEEGLRGVHGNEQLYAMPFFIESPAFIPPTDQPSKITVETVDGVEFIGYFAVLVRSLDEQGRHRPVFRQLLCVRQDDYSMSQTFEVDKVLPDEQLLIIGKLACDDSKVNIYADQDKQKVTVTQRFEAEE